MKGRPIKISTSRNLNSNSNNRLTASSIMKLPSIGSSSKITAERNHSSSTMQTLKSFSERKMDFRSLAAKSETRLATPQFEMHGISRDFSAATLNVNYPENLNEKLKDLLNKYELGNKFREIQFTNWSDEVYQILLDVSQNEFLISDVSGNRSINEQLIDDLLYYKKHILKISQIFQLLPMTLRNAQTLKSLLDKHYQLEDIKEVIESITLSLRNEKLQSHDLDWILKNYFRLESFKTYQLLCSLGLNTSHNVTQVEDTGYTETQYKLLKAQSSLSQEIVSKVFDQSQIIKIIMLRTIYDKKYKELEEVHEFLIENASSLSEFYETNRSFFENNHILTSQLKEMFSSYLYNFHLERIRMPLLKTSSRVESLKYFFGPSANKVTYHELEWLSANTDLISSIQKPYSLLLKHGLNNYQNLALLGKYADQAFSIAYLIEIHGKTLSEKTFEQIIENGSTADKFVKCLECIQATDRKEAFGLLVSLNPKKFYIDEFSQLDENGPQLSIEDFKNIIETKLLPENAAKFAEKVEEKAITSITQFALSYFKRLPEIIKAETSKEHSNQMKC